MQVNCLHILRLYLRFSSVLSYKPFQILLSCIVIHIKIYFNAYYKRKHCLCHGMSEFGFLHNILICHVIACNLKFRWLYYILHIVTPQTQSIVNEHGRVNSDSGEVKLSDLHVRTMEIFPMCTNIHLERDCWMLRLHFHRGSRHM